MYPHELRILEGLFFSFFFFLSLSRWIVWCCAAVHVIRSFPPSSIGATKIQMNWSSERINLDPGYSKCISFTNLSWACIMIVRNLNHQLGDEHSSRCGSTSWKKNQTSQGEDDDNVNPQGSWRGKTCALVMKSPLQKRVDAHGRCACSALGTSRSSCKKIIISISNPSFAPAMRRRR